MTVTKAISLLEVNYSTKIIDSRKTFLSHSYALNYSRVE